MIARPVRGACAVALFFGLLVPTALRGEDAPKKNARLLFLTQSAGFKHGSVTIAAIASDRSKRIWLWSMCSRRTLCRHYAMNGQIFC